MVQSLKDAITSCCKKGHFTLTSGIQSDFYIDIKQLMLDSVYLAEIARLLYITSAQHWRHDNIRAVGGMELGAVPLATAFCMHALYKYTEDIYVLNKQYECDQFIVRKEPREHGTKTQIEGLAHIQNYNTLILDDVLTTGGSIIKTRDILKKEGINVVGALVVVDRQDIDVSTLDIPVVSLFTKKQLMSDVNG